MTDRAVEHLPSTAGRAGGVLGVVLGLAAAGLGISQLPTAYGWRLLTGALLFVVLVYATRLRPRISLAGDDLVLRGMVETVRLPLAAVQDVAVRQMLVVRVAGRSHVGPAVGYSWRKLVRTPIDQLDGRREIGQDTDVPQLVQERLRRAAEDARMRVGVDAWSEEQAALASGVRRERSWPMLVAMVALAVAFVLSFLV